MRKALLVVFGLTLAAACTREAPPPGPSEIAGSTVCALDGMTLADYPGPKGQVHYSNGDVEYYCDTVELFSILLAPEQRRRVSAAYTQDMAGNDWNAPRDAWIDARSAWYVRGSKLRGSMGPTLASFARREDAQAFAAKYGGQVLAAKQITVDMVDLRGGASHDERM